MKKRKIWISIISSLVCVVVLAFGILYIVNEQQASYYNVLDSHFTNLSEFKLESPMDATILSNYQIVEYSTDSHVGIDFFAKSGVSSIPFLAMYDGYVSHIKTWVMENQGGTDNYAIEMWVEINSQYKLILNFECWGYTTENKIQQEANILVHEGQFVSQGDVLGNLMAYQQSAHVHFSLATQSSFVVPEPYFSTTAQQQLNTLLPFPYDRV